MKIEDVLQNKLSDFDAGFDENAWLAVRAKTSSNPASLKDSLSNYDAGYNDQAWTTISSRVAQGNAQFRNKQLLGRWKMAAALVGAICLGFLSYPVISNFTSESTDNPVAESNAQVEVPTQNSATNQQTNPTQPSTEGTVVLAENEEKEELTEETTAAPVQNDVSKAEKTPTIIPAYLSLNEEQLCLGEELQIRVNGDIDDYFVMIGDKKFKSKKFIKHRFNRSGTFALKLINKKNRNQVIDQKVVQINERPKAIMNLNTAGNENISTYTLTSINNQLSDVKWYVGSSMISRDQELEYTFNHKGKYRVKLVAEDENGCQDSSEQTVRILKAYNLMATQIFNPSKENWMPLGLKQKDQPFTLTIIGSDGSTAFETDSSELGWNGVVAASGKTAEDGDEFYWIARVKQENGRTQEYAGSFIISSKF